MKDAHKSQVFLWMLCVLAAGIAMRSFVVIPAFVLLVGVIAGGASSALGFSRKSRALKICGMLLIACVAGIARFDQAIRGYQEVFVSTDRAMEFHGIVWEEPRPMLATQQLIVRVDTVDGRPSLRQFFLRAVTKPYPAYEIGEEITLRGLVRELTDNEQDDRPKDPRTPQTALFPEIEKIKSTNQRPVRRALAHIRRAFERNLDAVLPEPHAALVKGLLIGERASIPQFLTEQFRRTGTSHITALSGYNITLVGKFFARACMMLTVPFYASFWLASSSMVLFVVMAGASASAVRAGIIALLILIADREGRQYNMTNALAFAGAVMLLDDPLLLRFDAGFQLSFLATIGLVYGTPRVERWLDGIRDRVRRWFGKPAHTRLFENNQEKNLLQRFLAGAKKLFIETSAAQLAVLPLLIYLFGYASLVSPLANIFVLAAVPYAMASGFITGVAGFVGIWLARILAPVSWILAEYILWIVRAFSAFPLATLFLGRASAVILVGIYAIVWWRTRRDMK